MFQISLTFCYCNHVASVSMISPDIGDAWSLYCFCVVFLYHVIADAEQLLSVDNLMTNHKCFGHHLNGTALASPSHQAESLPVILSLEHLQRPRRCNESSFFC